MAQQTRSRGTRAGLTRRAILEAACAMVSEAGAEPFSIRSLGARLRVDPMAIHYHFGGRDRLLDAVADHLLLATPPARGDSWEELVRGVAEAMLATISGSPMVEWSRRAIRGIAGEAHLLALVRDALRLTGLPDRDALTATRALLGLAIGSEPAATHGGRAEHTGFRQGTALLIDGLRMRTLERRVAAGES